MTLRITEEEAKQNPKLQFLINKALRKDKYSYRPNEVILVPSTVISVVTQIDKSIYIFNITPIGKPRMTRRDKWQNTRTAAATKYMVWRSELERLIAEQNFILGEGVKVLFLMPFKKEWSREKRNEMRGKPHQIKPDADNMLKGFIDVCCKSDQTIYEKHCLKFWWDTGKIVVIRNKPSVKSLLDIKEAYNALINEIR